MVQRIDAYQQFLKRDMLDHLEPHSSIGSHCLCRLLGGQEHDYHCRDCETTRTKKQGSCSTCADRKAYCTDCPESCGKHEEHCALCVQRFVIFAEIRRMISMLEASSEGGRLQDKLLDVKFLVSRFVGDD